METNTEEAKNYLDAYDRGLDMFKLHNENYFKRTQVLMVVIQSALFVGGLNFLSRYTETWTPFHWVLLAAISTVGMVSAWIWRKLGKRQKDYLEYCRTYLRDIECRLISLDVPLRYFKHESTVFLVNLIKRLR